MAFSLLVSLGLVGCGGGGDSPAHGAYTVRVLLSGLAAGTTITLLDNGVDPLDVSANGAATFATPLAGGTAYAVTIGKQPAGQACAVSNGSGTVRAVNVSGVLVTCRALPLQNYSVGGTVSGLTAGESVELLDNVGFSSPGNSATITENGAFSFATVLPDGYNYQVSVTTQPTTETCVVVNGSGTLASANVSSISVTCTENVVAPPPTYTIGGSISGLPAGQSVTLLDNGTDFLPLSANGIFVFKTPVASGAPYAITIGTQPTSAVCTVSAGSAQVTTGNVTDVAVICDNRYTIGGSVTGLITGQSLILLDNGVDALAVAANGAFTFNARAGNGATYAVTVGTQPTNGLCSITSGSGAIAAANVSNVKVACVANGGPGPGAATGFWIPFQATPVDGTTGGKSGLFLLPSDAFSSAPTPVFVNHRAVNSYVGQAQQFSNYADPAATPHGGYGAFVYSGVGSDGKLHLYGVKLSDTSIIPVEHQIGNLAIASDAFFCVAASAQSDLSDPSTFFMLLAPGNANGCYVDVNSLSVVHFTDSATTAPSPTPLLGTDVTSASGMVPVYDPAGRLGGLVYLDPNSQTLNFFTDPTFGYGGGTFGHPQTLLNGVQQANLVFDASTGLRGGLYQRIGLTADSGAYKSLYKISAAGVATRVYGASGTIGYQLANDANNLYFTDSDTPNDTFLQVALGGTGPPLPLYSAPTGSITRFVGSSGTALVLENDTFGNTSQISTLSSIPVGVHSTTAMTIAAPFTYSGAFGATMYVPTAGFPGAIYVNLTDTTFNTDGSTSYAYSSTLLGADGTIKQAREANSTFLFGAAYPGIKSALQAQGISDTTGGYGGGAISVVDVTTLNKTALQLAGGAPYTIGTGFSVVSAFALSTTGAVQLSDGISSGLLPDSVALYDLTRNLILPVSFANTDITPN